MKKKYITPKVETTMCLVEDFIAATGQGAETETPDGKHDTTTDTNADGQKSKQYNAWDTWED